MVIKILYFFFLLLLLQIFDSPLAEIQDFFHMQLVSEPFLRKIKLLLEISSMWTNMFYTIMQ